MGIVVGGILGVNEDVVQIHNDEFSKKLLKDVVHEILEDGRGVGKSKGNNVVLVGSELGAKSGFPLVTLSNSHKVVRIRQVKAGEAASGTKFVK